MTADYGMDNADRGLAALALLEGVIDNNKLNRDAILDGAPLDVLMTGMTVLAHSLALALAAASGVSVDEVVEMQRATFLSVGAV